MARVWRGTRLAVARVIVAVIVAGSGLGGCGDDSSPTGPGNRIIGSGRLVRQDRAVGGFTGVNLAGLGNLRIQLGAQEALTVEAEDNLQQHIQAIVQGGVLVIRTAPGVELDPTRQIRYFLTVATLEDIVLAGVGDIEIPALRVARLSLTLTGVGNIACSGLDADALMVMLSGVGNVSASGQAITQTVTLTGVGDYQAQDLQSEEATVQLNGSGSATVRVSVTLVATITGSGSIFYIGNPTLVVTITGSGSVVKIG